MKTIVTSISIFLFALFTLNCNAQPLEYLIPYDANSSATYVQMIEHLGTGPVLYVVTIPYNPNDEGGHRPICGITGTQAVIQLDASGDIVDRYVFDAPYDVQKYLHPFGNTFFSVSSYPDQYSYTVNGAQAVVDCQRFVAGSVDTASEVVLAWTADECDFEIAGGMFYDNNKYCMTYSSRSETYLITLNQTLQKITSTQLSEYSYISKPTEDMKGFYLFTRHSSNQYSHRLQKTDLSGNISSLSSYVSHPDDDFPRFDYDGDYIYVFPGTGNSQVTKILKYNTDGTLKAEFDPGLRTVEWVDLGTWTMVFCQGETNDDKPVKVFMLGPNFELIAEKEYGFEGVFISDVQVNTEDQYFTVVGRTGKHFLESEFRDRDDIYYLEELITNVADLPRPSGDSPNAGSRFYPNPNDANVAYIEFVSELDTETLVLKVFDMQGKAINLGYHSVNNKLIELNTDQLSTGIYTYSVSSKANANPFGGTFMVRH